MGGKKKHQKKHQNSAKKSTSNNLFKSDFAVGCEHVTSAFTAKKLANAQKVQRVCETCPLSFEPENTTVEEQNIVNEVDDTDIWLCLLCGREGCSRWKEGHALGHYERQPQHCVVFSLKHFTCWCYKCDAEIYISSGALADYISALIKHFTPTSASSVETDNVSSISDAISIESPVEIMPHKKNTATHRKVSKSVKGLANIGNTCFFNSTLQCLFHSSNLEYELNSFLQATTYSIPLPADTLSSAALQLRSADKCQMSLALRDTFLDLRSSSAPLVYPNHLFNQICAKVPRFRGYQQQDAHELLRHLLDTVKSEEILRIKSSLSEKLFPTGIASSDETEKLKRLFDVIGNTTTIDGVFGGEMVDTIVCLECHSINTILQHFLDVSLPLKRSVASHNSSSSLRNDVASNRAKRNKLKIEKKQRRRPKEDKDGDWDDNLENNDENDVEVSLALAMSMESDAVTSTLGRPDSGLGSGSSGGDPSDSAFDSLPLITPTESEELTDENLLASIAALQISNRESFPSSRKMSNKELRKRLQTLGNRPPPADNEKSLYAALYWYTEREELKCENRYACEQCQQKTGNKKYLTEGTKQTLIARPPKILTLHMKRFEQVESRRSTVLQKISTHIDFPAELDIAPFLSRETTTRHWKEAKALAAEDALPTCVLYSLRGVVEHSGSLNGGHYVAYVRPQDSNPSSTEENWFCISDGHVKSVSLDTVLRSNAYVLFYELDLKTESL